MNELWDEPCKPCRAGATPVSQPERTEWLCQLPGWRVLPEDVPKLQKAYAFRNFRTALAFTQAVGELAEAANHHPRIMTEWGMVTVTWWTHTLGDLHRNDFILAARTERLADQGN